MVVYGRMRVNQWMRSDDIPRHLGRDRRLQRRPRPDLGHDRRHQGDARPARQARPDGRRRRPGRDGSPRGRAPAPRRTTLLRRRRPGRPAQLRAMQTPRPTTTRWRTSRPGRCPARTVSGSSRASDADSGVGAPAVSLAPMPEFIYIMSKARKAHGDKVILDDVTLSFYPAPRSASSGPTAPASPPCSRSWPASTSLQRRGAPDARATPSASSCRSRQLNEDKTVLGNVEEGARRDQGASSTATTRSRPRWPSRTPTSTR